MRTRTQGWLALALSLLLFLELLIPWKSTPEAAEAVTPTDASVEGDASAFEYVVQVTVSVVQGVTALTALGNNLNDKFKSIATQVNPSGSPPPPPPQGGTTEFSDVHQPGGATSSSRSVSADFADGAHLDSTATATSDFTRGIFELSEFGSVLNSTLAVDEPNVRLEHEVVSTLTLFVADPGGLPPGSTASLRMDVAFTQLDWGIGGPVPLQDGVFEIVGPGGASWGFTMVKNTVSGQLEIQSTNGPALGDFTFDGSGSLVDIQGVDFQSEEVLRSVSPGPSFDFDIPYGVPTDVSLTVRRRSHTVVPDLASVPALLGIAQWMLAGGLAAFGGRQLLRKA